MPPKVRTVQLPEAGSAAKASQIFLGEDVRVVSAFQNIAATHLADLDHDIDCDVFVCGNDPAARATVVGVAACLDAGVNDIGGTLMDESITRAAGSGHGQEMTPEAMEGMLVRVNRPSRQRTTLYADACDERRQQSMSSNIVLPPTRLAG
jgi:predicted dinucleotide-binding enzyme